VIREHSETKKPSQMSARYSIQILEAVQKVLFKSMGDSGLVIHEDSFRDGGRSSNSFGTHLKRAHEQIKESHVINSEIIFNSRQF
jgi:hypothetical protein